MCTNTESKRTKKELNRCLYLLLRVVSDVLNQVSCFDFSHEKIGLKFLFHSCCHTFFRSQTLQVCIVLG